MTVPFRWLLLPLVLLVWERASATPVNLGEHCEIRFATVAEGKAILAAKDDYTRRLAPLERRLKLKSAKAVSDEEFRAAAGADVGAWPAASSKSVRGILEAIRPRLIPYASLFPRNVFLIFTNNKAEAGMPHTRANGIVLPKRVCTGNAKFLRHALIHELFHVLSRHHPALRDRLYAVIGFEKCQPLQTTPELTRIQLTNPDCPLIEHFIRITVDERKRFAVPFLALDLKKVAAEPGKAFMHYADLKLLLVNLNPEDRSLTPSKKEGRLELVEVKDVTGFYETIGTNTHYILHPEEIVAENFVHLVEETPDLPSPQITKKARKVLLAAARRADKK